MLKCTKSRGLMICNFIIKDVPQNLTKRRGENGTDEYSMGSYIGIKCSCCLTKIDNRNSIELWASPPINTRTTENSINALHFVMMILYSKYPTHPTSYNTSIPIAKYFHQIKIRPNQNSNRIKLSGWVTVLGVCLMWQMYNFCKNVRGGGGR